MTGQEPDRRHWTVVHQVRRQAEKTGDRVFVTFGNGSQDLTYRAFDERSERIATALALRGVEEGDRIMMLVKNRCEFLLAMVGAMKAGAIFVPINTELRGAFLQHQLHNCEPKLLVCEAGLIDAFEGVDAGHATPAHVVIVAG